MLYFEYGGIQMDKKQLTPEEKRIKSELKEKRQKEKFLKSLNEAYTVALKDDSLPEFRIKDGVILIKRLSDNELQQLKSKWLEELKQQIDNFTFEDLCEVMNEPFETNIREYNPLDRIRLYFYHKHQVDLFHPQVPHKIVDNF